jgi:hypothetical protein
MWLVSCCIVLLFLTVPYSIFKYSYLLFVAIVTVEVFMIFKGKKGVACLVFAYSVMIPSTSSKLGTGATNYITYIYVFIAMVLYVVFLNKKPVYNFKFAKRLVPILLILAFLFSLRNSSFDDIKLMAFFILSTYGVFYITFLDKMSLSQFYHVLDLIFYFTILYVYFEIAMQISPYQVIYADQLIDFQLRAKGLLGHPLLLSGFLSFYLVALLTKWILEKKLAIFNFLLAIPFMVLTASKTGIILFAFSLVVYIIVEKIYRKLYFIITVVLLAIGAALYIPSLDGNLAQTPLERIVSSNFDQRLGSYPVAMDIFSNNLLGIGPSKDALRSEIKKNGLYSLNALYNSEFLVFDNTYLTLLVSYGLLSILLLVIYINPLAYLIKAKSKYSRPYLNAMILVFAVWFLQNFSFDSFIFFPINSFYFLLAGFMLKDFKLKIHALAVKNNNKINLLHSVN